MVIFGLWCLDVIKMICYLSKKILKRGLFCVCDGKNICVNWVLEEFI